MENSALRIVNFCIFTIFFIISAALPAYSKGSQEAELIKADELIVNREFDAAVFLLTDYARRNPDKFDLAQERLQIILRVRDEFNRTADELIETLINEPENNEKILALSRHLYNLEDQDSPLLINFVARTREIAAFNVYRNRLRGIMERGRSLLDRGDSAGALQVYAQGMEFMQVEFYSTGFGANIENQARQETDRLNSMIASFQQTSSQLGTASAEYVRAVSNRDITGIPNITNRLTAAMDRFIALKQGFYTSADTFERILNNIRQNNPEMGDRNHLVFIIFVMNGRADESIQEGMFGAFDTYWANSVDLILNAVISYADNAKKSSISAISEKNYHSAAASVERISSYIDLTAQFFNRRRLLISGSNPQTITLYDNNILRADIPQFMETRALNESCNFLLKAANISVTQNIDRSSLSRWQEGRITAVYAMQNEQQTRNTIAGMQRSIESIRADAVRINTEINSYHNTAHIADALKAIDAVSVDFFSEELQSAARYYGIAHNALQKNLTAGTEQLERSRNYLNGESRTGENGETIVYRYPSEALQLLSAMLAETTANLQSTEPVLTLFRNEPKEIAQAPVIIRAGSEYQSIINQINNIRAQGQALSETARARSSQAESLKLEGERIFREAQAAFQRREYDAARERIQQADNRFNRSLEIQESASLRQMRDAQLISLGRAISAAQMEEIIAEVHALVNSARSAYFSSNFQQAEENLIRARNRWSITSPDEHEEVMYWLGIVRNALTVSSERTIPPTAPLYPEMSQLLSQAQRNYEEGMRFYNSGQRSRGLAKFDEARELTREVRLMFPLNQEAGILNLRIEQFLDPVAFNASFEQRMRSAITGTRQRSLEAYADIQNLAEINPRYPNLRTILSQAEIDIGLRPPPISPANIARSRELTSSARRIFDTSASSQYEIARTQLNEAILLNPENNEARLLRDRLLTRMYVPDTIILTNEDEAIYQRALREHNAGNNLVAWALTEELMKNPRNRNITKVVELQQRIRSVL